MSRCPCGGDHDVPRWFRVTSRVVVVALVLIQFMIVVIVATIGLRYLGTALRWAGGDALARATTYTIGATSLLCVFASRRRKRRTRDD